MPPTPGGITSGTWRKGIELPVERPEPPADLSPEARAIWDRLCDHTEYLGVLSRVDGLALFLMVQSCMMYRRAMDIVREMGITYERQTPRGPVRVTNPAVNIVDRTHKQILEMANQFGLTPRSRRALGIKLQPHEAGDDDLDWLLGSTRN